MPAPRPTLKNTVLVVDDTPDSLRFLTTTIEQAGLTVLIATNGENALELLQNAIPEMILMDGVMPVMDGFETTRLIKRDPRWAHIPVMFMTGLSDTGHVVMALECGGVDYIRKPVVVDELLARLRVHLNNARIARGSQVALDATGRHLFAVDGLLNLLWCTPQAEKLLSLLDRDWDKDALVVPAALEGALQRLWRANPLTAPAIRIETGGMSLELGRVAAGNEDEMLVRMTDVGQAARTRRLQDRFGLTGRESEVLLWISYGKPNREISEILGISPRTVNKHLQQIFEKLGVETRAAAAALTVRAMSQ
jgi:DNA-binding NarL/FixJ family response regulator